MEIREATEADWPGMWPIIEATLTAGETYTWEPDSNEQSAHDWWFQIGSPGWTLVAVDGDVVLGVAKCGPNQRAGGSHVGTASFMVDPAHSGRGVGRALGEAVVSRLRDEGFRSIQFNAVVETNVRAVALWQSLGFEILTTIPEAFRHPTKGYVGLNVMWRSLVD